MTQITRDAEKFSISGMIDENLDFAQLYQFFDIIRLDLGGVTGMNSTGAAKLIQLTQRRAGFLIEYYRCPTFFVHALNQVPLFLGPKKDPRVVKSLYYPYFCTVCDVERLILLETAAIFGSDMTFSMPVLPCPKCAVIMRLLEDPEDYLFFTTINRGNP